MNDLAEVLIFRVFETFDGIRLLQRITHISISHSFLVSMPLQGVFRIGVDRRSRLSTVQSPDITQIIGYTIPYHKILYHKIPYHKIPYHKIPYHEILYHEILYHKIYHIFTTNK